MTALTLEDLRQELQRLQYVEVIEELRSTLRAELSAVGKALREALVDMGPAIPAPHPLASETCRLFESSATEDDHVIQLSPICEEGEPTACVERYSTAREDSPDTVDLRCSQHLGLYSRHRRGHLAGKELYTSESSNLELDGSKRVTFGGRQSTSLVSDVSCETPVESHLKPRKTMTGVNKGRASTQTARGEEENKSLTASRTSRQSMRGSLNAMPSKGSVEKFVRSVYWEATVLVLIVANSLYLGFQTDHMARRMDTQAVAFKTKVEFHTVDRVFGVFFVFELVVRLYVFGVKFFYKDQAGWNWFDFVIVLCQVFEELFGEVFSAALSSKISVVRMVRMLRLIRVLRLVRVLQFVKELRTIVYMLMGSMRPFLWTFVLLGLLMYMLGVCLTQLVTEHIIDSANVDSMDRRELASQFGSLGSTILVLYQIITNGRDWNDVSGPLMNQISPWFGLLISSYVGFSLFAVMNIITGLFVDTAVQSARKESELYMLHNVRTLFAKADGDHSGDISWEEFSLQLDTPAMQMYFKHIDLDIDEAKDLFCLVDIDGNGSIDPEEFVNGCVRLQGQAKAIDLAILMHEYKVDRRTDDDRYKSILGTLQHIQHEQKQLGKCIFAHTTAIQELQEAKSLYVEATCPQMPEHVPQDQGRLHIEHSHRSLPSRPRCAPFAGRSGSDSPRPDETGEECRRIPAPPMRIDM